MADASIPVVDTLHKPATTGALNTAPTQTPEQLRSLAAQFESLLLGQMMQAMRQSMFDDEDTKGNGFGDGPMADAVFSELSQALSRSGGMGLGQALQGPLSKQAGFNANATGLNSIGDLPPSMGLPMPLDSTSRNSSVGLASSPISAMVTSAALNPIATPTAAMPGRVSSGYGWRNDPLNGQSKFHKGVDLAMPVGQDVPAARNGEVAFAGSLPGYGLTVVVKHDDRTSTRYAHLSQIMVAPGDAVGAGETIALSGATGRVTGPHLHFEVLEDGEAVDPREW